MLQTLDLLGRISEDKLYAPLIDIYDSRWNKTKTWNSY